MRIWERYSSDLENEKFDAIVIGSGMGGLSTAALLSKAGKRVLVLERHFKVGGWTHTFKRGTYEWDVGVHYIGSVDKKNGILRRLFDDITDARLQWSPMPDNYDRIIFPDASYDLIAGREQLIEKLSEYFPRERDAIVKYLKLVKECNRSAVKFFSNRALPKTLGNLTYRYMSRPFLKFADRTTWDVLSSLTSDRKLMGVLTGQYGNYGLPPKKSSFAIHAAVVNHYLYGGNYPVGGSRSIAESIAPVIHETGGKIIVNAQVDEIIIHRNRAVGVKLTNGEELRSSLVISSAGITTTFSKLVRESSPPALNMDKVNPSCAHLCLYIGLKGTAEKLGLEGTNLWIYPDYDHDANVERFITDTSTNLAVVYISFPSTKDPDWEENHGDTATMEAITLAPYDMFSKWEGTNWKKRGEDYENLKNELTNRIMRSVYAHVPQVEGHIDHLELSTPLTTRDFLGYSQGEIYGIDHSPERFRQKWLRPQTSIKNLYLTGQDIVTDGVAGALMSGVVTTSAILRKNVIKDVLRRTS